MDQIRSKVGEDALQIGAKGTGTAQAGADRRKASGASGYRWATGFRRSTSSDAIPFTPLRRLSGAKTRPARS